MCEREDELVDALRNGFVEPELRKHAAGCSPCRDLLDVAGTLLEDRNALMRRAQVPASGLVWWQTKMRLRQEAARRAMFTARLVQVVLVTLAVILGVILMGPKNASIDFEAIVTATRSFAIPLMAVIGLLILAPVTVYFVLTEE